MVYATSPKHIGWVLGGLATASLLYSLAASVQFASNHAPTTTHATISATPSGNSLLKEEGVAHNLFGGNSRTQTHQKTKNDTLPTAVSTTRLPYILKSVFVSSDPASATAVIMPQGKPEEIYGPGDQVSSTVTVEAVYHDGVLLNNNGRMETLPFDFSQSHAANATTAPPMISPHTTKKKNQDRPRKTTIHDLLPGLRNH